MVEQEKEVYLLLKVEACFFYIVHSPDIPEVNDCLLRDFIPQHHKHYVLIMCRGQKHCVLSLISSKVLPVPVS